MQEPCPVHDRHVLAPWVEVWTEYEGGQLSISIPLSLLSDRG